MRNKLLPQTAPLLLKIRNGDFDYSHLFDTAKRIRDEAQRVYELTYKHYIGNDESNRKYEALDASRSVRKSAVKRELEAGLHETLLLDRLRSELEREFEIDLWDKAMEVKRGIKTIEDLYWWYKKKTKEVITKSELCIQLKRANTKGLEHLF